jgi:adenosylcobinamide-GDP ribazoletransferase
MAERVRAAVASLSFLTAVPVGRAVEVGERDLRRGLVLFPVVGGAVGLLVAVTAWAAALVVPPLPASVAGVALGVAATAALHLDGLGDLADGVGATLSGRDPADVMRDPRLGAFGVIAVVLDLLLKASLLATLVTAGFPWQAVAAGALSRLAPATLAWRRRYAGGGTGAWTDGVGAGTAAAALLLAAAIAVPTAGMAAGAMALGVVVAGAPIAWWSRRRLGGITGDGFGAATELGETFALAVAVALR